MSQIDYTAMSDQELKEYFIKHREDKVAFQAYLERRHGRKLKVIIAFISLVKYDDNLYGKIKAVHLLKYKNETIFLRLSPKNI